MDNQNTPFRVFKSHTWHGMESPSISSPRVLCDVCGQVMAPNEFQGSVIGGINRRTGVIQNTDMSDDGSGCVIQADVPLAQVRSRLLYLSLRPRHGQLVTVLVFARRQPEICTACILSCRDIGWMAYVPFKRKACCFTVNVMLGHLGMNTTTVFVGSFPMCVDRISTMVHICLHDKTRHE